MFVSAPYLFIRKQHNLNAFIIIVRLCPPMVDFEAYNICMQYPVDLSILFNPKSIIVFYQSRDSLTERKKGIFLTWGSFYPLKIALQKYFFYSIVSL